MNQILEANEMSSEMGMLYDDEKFLRTFPSVGECAWCKDPCEIESYQSVEGDNDDLISEIKYCSMFCVEAERESERQEDKN